MSHFQNFHFQVLMPTDFLEQHFSSKDKHFTQAKVLNNFYNFLCLQVIGRMQVSIIFTFCKIHIHGSIFKKKTAQHAKHVAVSNSTGS